MRGQWHGGNGLARTPAGVLAAEFGEGGGLRAGDAKGNVELNESTQQVRAGRLRAVYPESGSSTNEPSLVIAEVRVVLVDGRGRRATGGRLEARPADGWAELTGSGVSLLAEDLRLEGEFRRKGTSKELSTNMPTTRFDR